MLDECTWRQILRLYGLKLQLEREPRPDGIPFRETFDGHETRWLCYCRHLRDERGWYADSGDLTPLATVAGRHL